MRPINLIPQDQRRSHGGASRTGPLAYIVVGALGVLLIGVVMLVLTSNKISDRESEVESLEARKAATTSQAAALAPFVSFKEFAEQRTQAVAELADNRFDWVRVIRQLSLILPPGVYVSDLSASSGGGGGEVSTGVSGPSLTINGCAPDQDSVAAFIVALKQIDGVTRVGLANSTLSEGLEHEGEGASAVCAEGGADFAVTIAFDEAPEPLTVAPVEEVPAEGAEDTENSGEESSGESEGTTGEETPATGAAASTAEPGASG